MRSTDEIQALAKTLPRLEFDEKVMLVEAMGLLAAYCPACLCTLGAPRCHPIPEVIDGENDPQIQDECSCPVADGEDDEAAADAISEDDDGEAETED